MAPKYRARVPGRLLRQDLRASWRLLRRSPWVSATAVVTLALGIGACATLFSVADRLLWNSLDYPEPERLVMLWEEHPRQKGEWRLASYPAFHDWREELDGAGKLAAIRPWRPLLTEGGAVAGLRGARVSADFFSVLGVRPIYGRGFRPGEDEAGAEPVVVLGHELWRDRFGGDPGIVGTALALEDSGAAIVATVVGVLPPEVRISEPIVSETAEIFRPLEPDPHRGERYFRVVGRLRPGLTIERTVTRLATVASGHRELYPQTNAGWQAEIAALEELVEAPVRPALRALLAAVGLVFLIACTNVGLLMLARENDRRQEISVRLALGAGRLWIGRRLFAESLLLCGSSGILGLVLSQAGVATLDSLGLTGARPVAVDLRTVIFASVVSLSTAMVFGLVPAARAAGGRLDGALRARRRPGGGGRSTDRLRRLLVLSEIAVASVLLVAAGLMLHSFLRLIDVDPGFEPRRALTLQLQMPRASRTEGSVANAMERLRRRVEALPRIDSAGLVNFLPMSGASFGTHVRTLPEAGPEERLRIELRGVSLNYFRSMGIPLAGGRDLAFREERPAIIVSEAVAARLWPGRSAIGRSLYLDWASGAPREVVGVVGEVRQHGARLDANPTVYVPLAEAPHRSLALVARAAVGEPSAVASEIRAEAAALYPGLVIDEVQTLAQVVRGTVSRPRGHAVILGAFALVALLLAAGGVYGVVAYSIAQRRYELGVRLALGARPDELVKLVTSEGLRDAAVGIGIGLTASLATTRWLADLLYGVGTSDPWTLAGTSILLFGVVAITSYLAARSASRIDPAVVLRAT